MAVSTRFGTDRSPSYLELITLGADTTAILQRRFQADRQLQRQIEIDPYLLFRTLVKEGTVVELRALRVLERGVERSVTRANVLWQQTRTTVQGAAGTAVIVKYASIWIDDS